MIWNFVSKKVKFSNVSKDAFKTNIREQSKDSLQFSFNKEAKMISNKRDNQTPTHKSWDNNFIYF